jgi:hypothetical protein
LKYSLDNLRKWLDPIDAFLAIELLKNETSEICEIGVYEGGFIITLLQNLPGLKVLAIDPYPGLNHIKQAFQQNLFELDFHENVQLVPDWSSISGRIFALVHIDGEHSESAVLKDLNFAIDNLAPTGIIVVDDIWHPLFPGIASATMKTIHQSDVVPFLTTRNKMYICRESSYHIHFANTLALLQQRGIPHSSGLKYGDRIGEAISSYNQDNSIKGYPQLVVLAKTKWEQLSMLGIATTNRNRTRKLLKGLTPPFVYSLVIRMLRRG